MAENNRRRKGPYKVYSFNMDVPIPRSTENYRPRQLPGAPAPDVEEGAQQEDDQNSNRSRSSLSERSSSVQRDNASHRSRSSSAHSAGSNQAQSENAAPASDAPSGNDADGDSDRAGSDNSRSDGGSDRESDDSADDGENEGDSDLERNDSDESEIDNNDDDNDVDNDGRLQHEHIQNDLEDQENQDGGYNDRADPGGQQGEPEEHQPRGPGVYPGCRITREEGILLIMNFALRFGLSDIAIESLLKVIDCHMPQGYSYGSFHTFQREMGAPALMVKRYYCPQDNCKRPVVFEEGHDQAICRCTAVNYENTLKKARSYFISLPLKEQLISLFKDRKVLESLRWQDRGQSDVINGRFYRNCLADRKVREGLDLTLQFNTDGVQVFKSSNIQMWPIQVTVNELPYKLRKNSIILCGLWYGGKPNMMTFLEPFVQELDTLHEVGFELPGQQPRNFKVHLILCTVDSMARPPLQGLKTWRGHCGCSFCLHPGVERGKTRHYPGNMHDLRTEEQHHDDTRLFMEQRGADPPDVNGIHGCSPLMFVPVFNIAQCFVPDYLHAVLLGVVKTMVQKFWTKPIPQPEPEPGQRRRVIPQHPYYIGSPAKMTQMGNLLLKIEPPSEITRAPRLFEDNHKWRGHEWKNFLLYYSLPCLKAVNFPARFYNHWFLLVFSMSIFLQDHIDDEEFEQASNALEKYVLTAEEVYGETVMKFNTHLLLHIPKSVKDFGALWASSTFSYEHYNGVLTKLYKSSQAADIQIVKNYVRLQGLKHKTSRIVDNVNFPRCLRDALSQIQKGKTSKHAFRANGNLTLLGAPHRGNLSVLQLNLVENLLNVPIQHERVLFYKRFIFKHVLHHIENYELLERRKNCIVRNVNDDFMSITHILKVETTEVVPREICVVLGLRLVPTDDQLCADRNLRISSDQFVTVVRKTQECLAIFPQMVGRKCVLTFYPGDDEKYCCFPLANLLERD